MRKSCKYTVNGLYKVSVYLFYNNARVSYWKGVVVVKRLKVSQVAEELGVSRQTIYNWIDKLDKELDKHIYKQGISWMIGTEGIEIIRKAIHCKSGYTESGEHGGGRCRVCGADNALQRYIDSLTRQIDRLETELDLKNRQFENFQAMLKDSQGRILELEEEVKEQEGLWSRLLKKTKANNS